MSYTRRRILNRNTENKCVGRILIPVSSQMVCIKSSVNKDYTIQFGIKSRKAKVPSRQICKITPTLGRCSFHTGNVTLNGPH